MLASHERSLLRRKVIDGLNKLGVDGTKPVMLSAGNREYLALQIVDGLHALGRSAEITPARHEHETRWMCDELREAGITFAPYPLPVPDPYAPALAALRAANRPASWPCSCSKEVILDANGIPDPYARQLERLRKEGRP